MSEDKHMSTVSRKWVWIGLLALVVAGALAYNYLDYQAVNLTCLNSTDAIDLDQGFVMGNTSCLLRRSTFASDLIQARGQYYFECVEGNYEITVRTSRVVPFACSISSISGTRIGPIPELRLDGRD